MALNLKHQKHQNYILTDLWPDLTLHKHPVIQPSLSQQVQRQKLIIISYNNKLRKHRSQKYGLVKVSTPGEEKKVSQR